MGGQGRQARPNAQLGDQEGQHLVRGGTLHLRQGTSLVAAVSSKSDSVLTRASTSPGNLGSLPLVEGDCQAEEVAGRHVSPARKGRLCSELVRLNTSVSSQVRRRWYRYPCRRRLDDAARM